MKRIYAPKILGLIAASVLCSCGRLGFDLIDLAPSDGRNATEPDAGGGSDASPAPDAQELDAAPGDVGTAENGGGSGGASNLDARAPDAAPDATARDSAQDAVVPDGGDASSDGASTDGGGEGSVVPPDGASGDSAAAPACAGAKEWAFGFDSDPTLADSNDDGVFDWIVRSGATFPVTELALGVWNATVGTVLDTRPLDDFSSRTVVDVRMRSVAVPPSGRGAVFWINLNEGGPSFSALFVSLALEADGGQTLSLWGKSDGATEVLLASFADLPESLVDVHLDIDPVALTASLAADGTSLGVYSFPQTGAPNADHFATVLPWGGDAEFDAIRIQRCP